VTTVSSPIVDGSERAIMAVSAVGFSAHLDKAAVRQLGEDLRERARGVSGALAGRVLRT
jgi:DNA-binding IclR family transcriptional regulator